MSDPQSNMQSTSVTQTTSKWGSNTTKTLVTALSEQPFNTYTSKTAYSTQFNIPTICSNPFSVLQPLLLNIPIIIIMRGLPGSGKSTIVQQIIVHYMKQYNLTIEQTIVCSADNYFIDNITGKYNFNVDELQQAHAYCMQQYINALYARIPLIVVDNTNQQIWNYSDYITYIQSYNQSINDISMQYNIQIVEIDTYNIINYTNGAISDIDLCTYRNSHTVTANGVAALKSRYEIDPNAIIIPCYVTKELLYDVLRWKRSGGRYVQNVVPQT